MNAVFVKEAVRQADIAGKFLSESQLSTIARFVSDGNNRLAIVRGISTNSVAIIKNTFSALIHEQQHLVLSGGLAYGNQKAAACLRDLDIILRYVTYAMLSGDSGILTERCLNGLRETYVALGVPCQSVALAIQKMKEITLSTLTTQKLEISEIREVYPKQWVTIEITKFKNGFPSQGVVLYYDHDINSLAKRISHLNGNNIYTFFTSRIDEKPEPLIQNNNNYSFIPISDSQGLLSELESYFNICLANIS